MKRKDEVKEPKYLGTVLCKYGEIEGEISDGYVREVCYRILCNGYEGEDWAHGGEERLTELYSASVNIWIRDFAVSYSTAVKSMFVLMSYPKGSCEVIRWDQLP